MGQPLLWCGSVGYAVETGQYRSESSLGRYDPGMKDARLPASLAAAGRLLRRKPRSYEQAWLFAALGPMPLGWLIGFLTFEIYKGWPSPVALPAIGYPMALVVQGLAWSYDVYQRGEP
jgi:hypothetical protein